MRQVGLWFPTLAYMLIIFTLSAQSNPLPQLTTRVWDKLLHVTEYAGLGLLWCRTCRGAGLSWPAAILLAVVSTAAFGASDEWHQSFVPGRTADIHDWFADLVGGTLGSGAYAAWTKFAVEPWPTAAAASPDRAGPGRT